jgi:hypothetical protein
MSPNFFHPNPVYLERIGGSEAMPSLEKLHGLSWDWSESYIFKNMNCG